MPFDVVFMGTPDFAVPTLRALHEAGHRVVSVYSQPPRRAGRRGLAVTPSPVHQAATLLGLPVATPTSLKTPEAQADFAALKPDLAIVVAYGLILPQAILDIPRLGCLNGHASLLPRWRGAAPVQRAIEAGDAMTGASIMRMEAGLDTGPVALMRETAIGRSETAGELTQRLATLTGTAMVEALRVLQERDLAFEEQAALEARTGRSPNYAAKIDKAEAVLSFDAPAAAVAARINAFSPFPGAHTHLPLGAGHERVKILRAEAVEDAGEPGELLDGPAIACANGAVRLITVQRAGGKPMQGLELARGGQLCLGGHALSQPPATP